MFTCFTNIRFTWLRAGEHDDYSKYVSGRGWETRFTFIQVWALTSQVCALTSQSERSGTVVAP